MRQIAGVFIPLFQRGWVARLRCVLEETSAVEAGCYWLSGEGLLIPQRLQREQTDCSLLHTSSDYRSSNFSMRAN
jgi:hypothetical protein